jgi:periplasmic mercuric ion binding protein
MNKIKYFAVTTMLIAFFFAAFNLMADEQINSNVKEAKIKTTAQCEQCKDRIEKAVKKLDGIVTCDLNVETKLLTVKFDTEKTKIETIYKAVNKVGYDADNTKADQRAYRKLPKCCQLNGHEK